MRIEELLKMSNQEAADILRKLQFIPNRCNGKSTTQLRIQVALAKAIYVLEKDKKWEKIDMLVDFNKTFRPTIEEDIETFENLIKIHASQFGRCSTCSHYKCEDVQDPGRCDVKDEDLFLQHLLDKNNTGCNRYEYDDKLRRNFISEIEKLKEAQEMSPEPKCFKCRYYKKYYNSNKYFCSKGYCVLKNKKGDKQ